jgi:hypothetical protein
MLAAAPALATASVAPDAMDRCIAHYRGAARPDLVDLDALDRVRAVCENILAGQYRLETLATGQRIYANQLFQNGVVMWMVVAITLSGVILAGIQLWATYKLAMAGKGVIADGGEATVEHNRLVVRSSVVGVIILALSFAFFTVYVLYVYRITDLPGLQTIAPALQSTNGAEEVPQ